MIQIYLDTSGSSNEQDLELYQSKINELLAIFQTAQLSLFNSGIYHTEIVKCDFKLPTLELSGSDLQDVICDIHAKKPDLAVILSDLYLENPIIPKDFNTNVLIVVPEKYNVNSEVLKLGTYIILKDK